ncbi:glycosyltransferase family 4 protein [Synoicihabitans lomoniglobus]|uniref:Glycosyltransferase family 1 protein n=1 Tax=Synoicihabitans lomoniglobus TaxID=2909285 RepID=A0AAF0CSQ2_9BACT|nr:glycosyltransferase family 4 protein [Opitutaceae bacterium LMO-M01]WED67357.1 glycosyltransferase family 1 protein [Opitutaceae bacterium LMO-M01]
MDEELNSSAAKLRVLVDLARLPRGGSSGGIRPAILEMIGWLVRSRMPIFELVLVVPANHDIGPWREHLRKADEILTDPGVSFDLAARLECDLVYSPLGSPVHACPGVPTVSLVVDVLHREFPLTLTDADLAVRELEFTHLVSVSDGIQVISDYTLDRFHYHYPLTDDRTTRIYLPIQDRFPINAKDCDPPIHLTSPYFFYPANSWIHKNHETLLVAYAIYRQNTGGEPWPLVLTGYPDQRMQTLRIHAHALGIGNSVHFLGFVDETRLAWLYRNAGGMIFPSLHEGFGIPLLEAMAAGVPIICGDKTAIPEVVGEAAILVDCRNPDKLAAQIEILSNDPGIRDNLKKSGKARLTHFSAEREAGALIALFARISSAPARFRHSGYWIEDGLTDPAAAFALPQLSQPASIHLKLKPLPAPRTLLLSSGKMILGEFNLPPSKPAFLTAGLPALASTLMLRILNANRLSSEDPRVHGVQIESLEVIEADNTIHNILAPCSQ